MATELGHKSVQSQDTMVADWRIKHLESGETSPDLRSIASQETMAEKMAMESIEGMNKLPDSFTHRSAESWEKPTEPLPPPPPSPQPEQQQPRQPPPDGGLVAWLQCLGSFFLFFNCWGVVNTFGVFQTFYEESLLPWESSSNISWVGSIQACLLMFVGCLAGPIFDSGHARALLIAGTILSFAGMIMTSLCTEYWQVVLAQGLTVGVGFGCLFVPSVSILPTYFSKKKSLAIGIGASGSSLGGVVYPILFHRIQPVVGFAWATRVIAFIMLGTLVIPVVCTRQRIRPPKSRKLVDWSPWTETPYLLFGIAEFFAFMGLYVPFFYVQLYAKGQGLVDENLGFYLLAIMNAGSFFGRIIPNYFADKVGPLHVLMVCGFMSSLLGFLWVTVSSTASVVLFSLFYGFFSGSFVSLPPAVVATMTADPTKFGTRLGMIFLPIAAGLLVGNPVAGAILAHGWPGLMSFCGACVILAVAFIVAARVAKEGWKFRAFA